MKDLTAAGDFRSLVLSRYEDLPPQQQTIASYLLDHLSEVPFLSVPSIAQRTGVSEATVSRFAQRLGYDGFSEMKMALLELLRHRLLPQAPPADDAADILASVARLEQGNVQRLVDALDRQTFRAAAAALFKADHVYAFGLGISSLLAEMAGYLLTEVGLRSTVLSTRYSSPREQLVALRPTDLLLAFSFPPYSKQTVELVREVAGRGLPTIVISDRATAPAAPLARHLFVTPSDNMMFTNATAAVTVLLNALTTEIAVRHQGKTVEALSQINRILAEDEDLIHGSG